MKLYHSPASPFVRKVMVVLHETGQLDAVDLVPAAGTPLAPGTMPVDDNPLGKLPTLITDDGQALYDSRVINRYLDRRAQTAGLYGAGPGLWRTLTLEALADGIMDAAILMVYEKRCRPEEAWQQDWIEAQWSKVARALDELERTWIDHLEAGLDIGGIGVGCALGYLDFRHPDRDWRSAHPKLAAWFEAVSRRPSFRGTVPQG